MHYNKRCTHQKSNGNIKIHAFDEQLRWKIVPIFRLYCFVWNAIHNSVLKKTDFLSTK